MSNFMFEPAKAPKARPVEGKAGDVSGNFLSCSGSAASGFSFPSPCKYFGCNNINFLLCYLQEISSVHRVNTIYVLRLEKPSEGHF